MHPRLLEVTERIRDRSREARAESLARMERARERGAARGILGCANFARGFAAAGPDKDALRRLRVPNLAIVSAYNDMLSAHQPFERFPGVIRAAARQAGAVVQFAGGVPAMCDGVTQGRAGMELSLMSRDVIAMATAVALAHDMFDAALGLGICDKIVPGLLMGALAFGHLCTFYGTANSNQMLMEIMGLHLPGAAFVHPNTPLRDALTAAAAARAARITALGGEYLPLATTVDQRVIGALACMA